MTSPCFVFIDNSGSTGFGTTGRVFPHYKGIVMKVAEELRSSTREYILWNTALTRTSFAALPEFFSTGGTQPSNIASYLGKLPRTAKYDLCIVTDGQVDISEVDYCDRILGEMEFGKVLTVLVITGGECNHSCTAPFTRRANLAETRKYDAYGVLDETTMQTVDIVQSLHLLKTICSSADLVKHGKVLETALACKTMGSSAGKHLALAEEIRLMKCRIEDTHELVRKASEKLMQSAGLMSQGGGGAVGESVPMEEQLTQVLEEEKNEAGVEKAIHLTRHIISLTTTDTAEPELEWVRILNRLSSMVNGSLRNAFSAAQVKYALDQASATKVAAITSPFVTSIPIVSSGEGDDNEGEAEEITDCFTCPVSLEATTEIAILVAAGQRPILPTLEKSDVKLIRNNPLHAIHLDEFRSALLPWLDKAVSIQTVQGHMLQSLSGSQGFTRGPETRRELDPTACIPLGNYSKQSFDILHATMARIVGASIGPKGVWPLVLWRIFATDSRFERFQSILPILQEHAKWTLTTITSRISMTGLPGHIVTKVKYGVAAWFVLASSMFTFNSSSHHLAKLHLPYLNDLIAFVELVEFQLPKGTLEYVRKLQILDRLMRIFKSEDTEKRKMYSEMMDLLTHKVLLLYCREDPDIRASFLGLIPAGEDSILIDGLPTALQCKHVLENPVFVANVSGGCSDVQALLSIYRLVDQQKKLGDIILPFAVIPVVAPTEESSCLWKYGSDPKVHEIVERIELEIGTARPPTNGLPRYHVNYPGIIAHQIPITEQISLWYQFGKCLRQTKLFPNVKEFIVFLSSVYRSFKRTLPWDIYKCAEIVVRKYSEYMQKHIAISPASIYTLANRILPKPRENM